MNLRSNILQFVGPIGWTLQCSGLGFLILLSSLVTVSGSSIATGGPGWARAHPLSSVAPNEKLVIFQMDVIY